MATSPPDVPDRHTDILSHMGKFGNDGRGWGFMPDAICCRFTEYDIMAG
ncbi:hypothetical protein ACFLYV_02020 [Chloroflexota bacterium]